MSEAKPFSLPVQLIKTQIYIERLRKKKNPEELYPHMELLKAKYEWIKNPVPVEIANNLNRPKSHKKRVYSKYDIVVEDDESKPQPNPSLKQSKAVAKSNVSVDDLALSKAQNDRPDEGASDRQEPKPRAVSFLDKPVNKPTEVPTYDDPMALLNPDGSRLEVQEVTPCEFCGRRFGPDAMARHVRVCMKNPDRKANVKQSTVKK